MASPWWQLFPVTVPFGTNEGGFGTEAGFDIGTPFHTALTAPFGGKVTATRYAPWGGEVDVAVQGLQGIKDETFLHLDQISVSPGQSISAGQQIGLSGGQLSGGTHPASPQYSTGPHTELDFFAGAPFASQSFNPQNVLGGAMGMGSGGGNGNTFTIPGLPGIAGVILGNTQFSSSSGLPSGFTLDLGTAALADSISQIPTQIGHGIADAAGAGATDLGIFFRRQAIAFFVAAIVLFVLFAEVK